MGLELSTVTKDSDSFHFVPSTLSMLGKPCLIVTEWLPQFQASHPCLQAHFPNKNKGMVVRRKKKKKKRLSSHVALCIIRGENLSRKLPSRLTLLTSCRLEQGPMTIPRQITGKER